MLPQLSPFDSHNQRLQSEVGPQNWLNPVPTERYHLVVIGGGTAGLVTAAGAAGLGAKVALVEKELLGGDCLNVGCVPSKALLSSAKAIMASRNANEFGVEVGEPQVDFSAVMERMRRLRSEISPHDSAQRFKDLGVDVYFGPGEFTDDRTIEVKGARLTFKHAVICTGARAAIPPIDGLKSTSPLTNESLFSLTELPKRLAVIGGGPIGCEMAQAFACFGSQVTLFERSGRVLRNDDPAASEIVAQSLAKAKVEILFDTTVHKVKQIGESRTLTCGVQSATRNFEADEILVAAGRSPNVRGMGLKKAGVEYDERQGVLVNDRLQTTNPRIFAAGDVCSRFQFTHAADYMARIVIGNSLFPGRSKVSQLVIPWCTYTSPEVAGVGLTTRQAQEQGIEVDEYVVKLDSVDRAILDSQTTGFAKALARKGSDEILGATVVGRHAGEMINEITLAMTVNASIPKWKKLLRLAKGVGLSSLSKTIHPYPTDTDALRKLGDAYNKTRLTPLVSRILKTWLRWTR